MKTPAGDCPYGVINVIVGGKILSRLSSTVAPDSTGFGIQSS